mmetsp:Transcript_27739/g.40995  ORF Transcript_27739/g.40995 Transcript_27739/m.40995 type:complete len:250 (-) Transcript_27739:457-1206(-)
MECIAKSRLFSIRCLSVRCQRCHSGQRQQQHHRIMYHPLQHRQRHRILEPNTRKRPYHLENILFRMGRNILPSLFRHHANILPPHPIPRNAIRSIPHTLLIPQHQIPEQRVLRSSHRIPPFVQLCLHVAIPQRCLASSLHHRLRWLIVQSSSTLAAWIRWSHPHHPACDQRHVHVHHHLRCVHPKCMEGIQGFLRHFRLLSLSNGTHRRHHETQGWYRGGGQHQLHVLQFQGEEQGFRSIVPWDWLWGD